ncbi:MAG: VWA domain-containing protein [Planctomycetes bacterium]|nr:VWA domain-containing protein [Planctomycetota bacterium]
MIPDFGTAANALLFLLLIPLVLFYFLKLKRPRLEIPSLVLWRQVLADARVNAPFQKFKRNLLLLLQVLLLSFTVLAAMQPFIRGRRGGIDRLAVLIDNSASMAAVSEAGGGSSLDAAVRRIDALIDGLPPGHEACIVSFSSGASLRCGFTDNRRVLRDALHSIRVEDVPGSSEDALRMVQAMSRTAPVREVVLVSDGNFEAVTDMELSFDLNFQKLPPPGPNLGITEFNASRSFSGGWDVFAVVQASADSRNAARLQISADSDSLMSETVFPAPGESQRIALRIPGEKPLTVSAVLVPDGFDSLSSDNAAYLDLPAQRPLAVYVPPSMTAFRRAFRSMGDVLLYPSDDSPGGIPAYDLVVSNVPADVDKPAACALFVGFVPPALGSMVAIQKDAGTGVVDWHKTAPLLRHVELADILLLDDPEFLPGILAGDVENAGFQVLVHGRHGPLLVERTTGPGRAFFMLFDTDRSTLPWRVGFPVMASNLRLLTMQVIGLADAVALRTGVLPALDSPAGLPWHIDGPAGYSRDAVAGPDGRLAGIPAPMVGVYDFKSADNTFPVGAALLSMDESSLATISEVHFNELSVSAGTVPMPSPRALWFPLGVVAFTFLLAEWWYFHRRPGGSVQ